MTARKSLAPGLLLAAPRLGDPNFEHTVVLLARHDDEGALGWVVNGKALPAVHELLLTAGLVPEGVTLEGKGAWARSARVGGPVSGATGWVLYRREEAPWPGEIAVDEDLAITGDMDALRALMHTPTTDFRLFLGYAGWSAGQLEGEIREGVWLPTDVDLSVVLDEEPGALWEHAYERTLGIAPAAFMGNRGGSA